MNELLQSVSDDSDTLVVLIVFGSIVVITVVGIVFTTIKRVSISNDREKSRREIAAYVAEGSMSPEDGERLLRASPKDRA